MNAATIDGIGDPRAAADLAGGFILATVEIDAEPEQVFAALTSDAVASWLVRPGVWDTRTWEGDVRPGGEWATSGVSRRALRNHGHIPGRRVAPSTRADMANGSARCVRGQPAARDRFRGRVCPVTGRCRHAANASSHRIQRRRAVRSKLPRLGDQSGRPSGTLQPVTPGRAGGWCHRARRSLTCQDQGIGLVETGETFADQLADRLYEPPGTRTRTIRTMRSASESVPSRTARALRIVLTSRWQRQPSPAPGLQLRSLGP